MTGEAPHLLDPEVLDSDATADGKQRGLYYCPSSQGRSPESVTEFVDSIFEVPLSCPGLPMTCAPRLTGGIAEGRDFPAMQSCMAEAVSRRRGCQAGSGVLRASQQVPDDTPMLIVGPLHRHTGTAQSWGWRRRSARCAARRCTSLTI